MSQVEVLRRPSLSSEGVRLLTKLGLQRTPPDKLCCHVDSQVIFFHSLLMFSTEIVLAVVYINLDQ
jgi:hypothetical protein